VFDQCIRDNFGLVLAAVVFGNQQEADYMSVYKIANGMKILALVIALYDGLKREKK
jgi:hypothetical protein